MNAVAGIAAHVVCRSLAVLALGVLAATASATVDVQALWDYAHPEVTEARLRAALADAKGDDALVLQTQIARTWGLRGDFAQARRVLAEVEPALEKAGPEPRVRHALELGRSWSSAAHAPESQTPEARAAARTAFLRAFDVAREARLDGLAVDALHMMAFVDTAPADQLKWDREALAYALRSDQPEARRWEASLRNNTGNALHELGRYDEALVEFQKALALQQRRGSVEGTRIAYWTVAWTLRAMGRTDEALAIQLRLEREHDAAGEPSADVYEELEALYRARGEAGRADAYAARRKALEAAR
jgi:tetratricopeptide (TPR) repeat protein